MSGSEKPTLFLEITEDKLIVALKAGEIQAFNYLYKKYSEALFGVILKIVNQHETAEDILQDVFLKIRKYISGYDAAKGRLFTWMLNTARHAAIDELRKTSSRGRLLCDELEVCILKIDERGGTQINTDTIGLNRLLISLTSHERQLLDLMYYKGFTHPEVAEYMGIPLGTVKSRIRGAIIKLRLYFA
ncbi:RNA polymerase sigma factor [Pedobacter sp. AW1-32]|uniref:RNA polymerase sigma factor n=1 Tax=Pedobacter sp. AW1-32 TaxID=3383026 RepID=UPI003FEF2869